jgi:hypothetical protein
MRTNSSEKRRAKSVKLGAGSLFFAFGCALFVLSCSLTSCVPLDELPAGSVPNLPGSSTGTAAAFPDLEFGYASVTSTHFTLKGYSQQDLDNLKQMVESEYNKIGNDFGLYSYMASGNYTLVEYRDKDEYLKKTKQPEWSHAVTAGTAIYFYPDQDLEAILAHYMVHMIFATYMGDKAASLKWLDEGLAMNEEVAKMSDGDRSSYSNSKSNHLRDNKMPFTQMTFFVSNSEEKRRTDVWNQQAESVVTYILSQGSALAFAQMLGELRNGIDIDRAIFDAYPAKFKDLNDVEAAWKYAN